MSSKADCLHFAIDPALQEAIHSLNETVTAKLGMKSNNGAAEQSFDHLRLPWADAEGFRIRPRNVPEGYDRRPGQALTDHSWSKREVIVLDQHNGVLGARLGNDCIGKALVD